MLSNEHVLMSTLQTVRLFASGCVVITICRGMDRWQWNSLCKCVIMLSDIYLRPTIPTAPPLRSIGIKVTASMFQFVDTPLGFLYSCNRSIWLFLRSTGSYTPNATQTTKLRSAIIQQIHYLWCGHSMISCMNIRVAVFLQLRSFGNTIAHLRHHMQNCGVGNRKRRKNVGRVGMNEFI